MVKHRPVTPKVPGSNPGWGIFADYPLSACVPCEADMSHWHALEAVLGETSRTYQGWAFSSKGLQSHPIAGKPQKFGSATGRGNNPLDRRVPTLALPPATSHHNALSTFGVGPPCKKSLCAKSGSSFVYCLILSQFPSRHYIQVFFDLCLLLLPTLRLWEVTWQV